MLEKTKQEDKIINKKTLYTITLSLDYIEKLKKWFYSKSWESYNVKYAYFGYRSKKTNVVAYNSGKVVIQGKNTEDFVRYVLEAQITGKPKIGYETIIHPTWFENHAGLDESGKGDLFGPLTSACVIAKACHVHQWLNIGLKDSKRIKSDINIMKLDNIIRNTKGVIINTISPEMPKYNELYNKFGRNLNKLLAWMHAKVLKESLKKEFVSWGMLDQFSKKPLVQNYFKKSNFDLRMEIKAESDPIVAAASIVARATYLKQMQKLSERAGFVLLKGVNSAVKEQGKKIITKFGVNSLNKFAKLHFRTILEIIEKPISKK